MARLSIELKRGKDESQLIITNKVTGKEVNNSIVDIFRAMTEDRLVKFKIANISNHGKKFICKIQSTKDKDSHICVISESEKRCNHEPHFNNDEDKVKGYFDLIKALSDTVIEECRNKFVKTNEEKHKHGDITIIKSLYNNQRVDCYWETTLEDMHGNKIPKLAVDILSSMITKEVCEDNNINIEMSKATVDTVIISFTDYLGNKHIRNFKTKKNTIDLFSIREMHGYLSTLETYKNILIADIKEANKYNSIIEFEV